MSAAGGRCAHFFGVRSLPSVPAGVQNSAEGPSDCDRIFWEGGAPGMRGENTVFGAASTPESSGSGQGAAVDSLGKNAL